MQHCRLCCVAIIHTIKTAAIYVRISSDQEGEGLGVARQLKDCTKWAKDRGITVADIYEDNDRSAYSGKVRPAYERLCADLKDDVVDGVIVWHPDRLHRSPLGDC